MNSVTFAQIIKNIKNRFDNCDDRMIVILTATGTFTADNPSKIHILESKDVVEIESDSGTFICDHYILLKDIKEVQCRKIHYK